MEETVQEAVQQASVAVQWNWLQLATIVGVVVALGGLIFSVCSRRRDAKTWTRIEVWMELPSSSSFPGVVFFQVHNESKMSIFLSPVAELADGDGRHFSLSVYTPGRTTREKRPFDFQNYTVHVARLCRILEQEGYTDTAALKFVVQDRTGRRHEQPVIVGGLKPWNTTVSTPTRPWYLRWFRKVVDRFRSCA